ncbi:MAG: mycothiol system anti-sigma-R factor, partial [Kineosporiaceae bacterium]
DRMYTYLDGELGEPDLHLVREHLEECAPCMSQHDVDLVVKKLLRRSCGGDHAPEELRERIVLQLTQLARTGSTAQVSHLSVEINR